ncbi:MAG TPA: type IV toxin-antitoxin system AbiEi family antitoxin domain-containing protein, partial [Solirubrobacteraceae bacterium]|nr:type IV toxin-antitoxin system AbiEi family antitoxin domain-containing protein [Solirubrobacteraceae bacterium]
MTHDKTTTESPRTPGRGGRAISPRSGDHQIAARVGTPLEGDFIVVVGSADSRIATLATAQHGRVAWWQLREAGISQAEVRSRVAAGWLIRVRHGVYAVGHLAPADHAREVEALLCAPPGTLLSHLTASRLWKLHDDPRAERAVDILVPSPAGQRRAHVRVHRTVVTSRL